MTTTGRLTADELAEAKEVLARYPGLLEHYRDVIGLIEGAVAARMARCRGGLLTRFAGSPTLDAEWAETLAVALAGGHLVALNAYTGQLTDSFAKARR